MTDLKRSQVSWQSSCQDTWGFSESVIEEKWRTMNICCVNRQTSRQKKACNSTHTAAFKVKSGSTPEPSSPRSPLSCRTHQDPSACKRLDALLPVPSSDPNPFASEGLACMEIWSAQDGWERMRNQQGDDIHLSETWMLIYCECIVWLL